MIGRSATPYRAAAVVGFALLLGASSPSVSRATDLACLPHARTQHYAHRAVRIPLARQKAFGDALQAYALKRGLSFSGDRPGDRRWEIFLQSPKFGVVMTIGADGRSDRVSLEAASNCVAPPEPWKPYWSDLNAFVDAWRRTAAPSNGPGGVADRATRRL